MKPLLIAGGHIIDPSQDADMVGDLLVSDGKIVWLGEGPMPSPAADCDVIRANGMAVCPGFIDLHCHLRDPGFEEKETIATGTQAAASGGFTTLCCMPNTQPAIDSADIIQYIRKKADDEGTVRVLPIGCVTRGRRGQELADMEKLAVAGVAGFSDDGDPVRDDELMGRALTLGRRLGLPVIDHCEEPVGGPPEGEVKIVARDLRLAAETGGWVHIAHVSLAASAGLVMQAKARGVHVTAEVTPHHLTLTKAAVAGCGTLAKVNPPLRTRDDCEALVMALKDGTIDVIATDHAPHTTSDKAREFAAAAAGISGFETAFGALMGLVHDGKLTLKELVSKLTAAPAKLLGEKAGGTGTLAIGARADIAILDLDRKWTVQSREFVSRGKNTPLDGTVLRGKVAATVAGGHLVYRDPLLIEKESAFVRTGQKAT